jgi:hypothetical protein
VELRYTLSFSRAEILALPVEVKQSLATINPEVADVLGVVTADTPRPQNVIMQDGTPTIPAERGQPNQASTVDPAIQAAGGAAMPPGYPLPMANSAPPVSINPVVPSAVPDTTGIPQPPPSPAPPISPIPQPQTAPVAGNVTREDMSGIIGKAMVDFGNEQHRVLNVLQKAGSMGILENVNLNTLSDANAPQLLQMLNSELGTNYAPSA